MYVHILFRSHSVIYKQVTIHVNKIHIYTTYTC